MFLREFVMEEFGEIDLQSKHLLRPHGDEQVAPFRVSVGETSFRIRCCPVVFGLRYATIGDSGNMLLNVSLDWSKA